MFKKKVLILAAGLLVLLAVGLSFAPQAGEKKPAIDKAREADVEAIRKHSAAFTKAFAKQDAKALALLWTEDGEHEDEDGALIRGREAIEKTFTELFKEKPKIKVEVLIDAVRFPAKDVAIEEGVLRTTLADDVLPTTTAYSVTHVREGGKWLMAASREWGAGRHRLDDLEWLLGEWKGGNKDQQVVVTFGKEEGKPAIKGTFTRKEKGKTAFSGTIKIAIDPQRGQIRSWHFDDDGGHAQSLWLRDGKNWVLDTIGALASGSDMACVNVLGRVGPNAITWRSIDRQLDGEALPDTPPVRLERVK